jgi:hypothetical protein
LLLRGGTARYRGRHGEIHRLRVLERHAGKRGVTSHAHQVKVIEGKSSERTSCSRGTVPAHTICKELKTWIDRRCAALRPRGERQMMGKWPSFRPPLPDAFPTHISFLQFQKNCKTASMRLPPSTTGRRRQWSKVGALSQGRELAINVDCHLFIATSFIPVPIYICLYISNAHP